MSVADPVGNDHDNDHVNDHDNGTPESGSPI
jgi:hypothetical protein